MKVTAGTIARTAVLAFSLLNVLLNAFGKNPLPFSDDEVYTAVSTVVAVAASLAAWWKNNSFTKAALKADETLALERTRDSRERGGQVSKLYYCRQTTEKCKSIRYPSKPHPYKYGTSGCIYTSGCGVCASLMVLHNFGFTGLDTAAWTQKCLLMGARSADGTDMDTVAVYLEKHYSIVSKRAKTVADLKNHLKAGGKAIVCVSGGGKQLFSNGGHYVYVGGLDKSGNLIVLDPYWYDGKFTMTANRRKYTKVKNAREVYVQPAALASDLSGIWLFTNAKGGKTVYAESDVNYKKATSKAPTVKPGTYTTTAVRGIYKGAGAATGRKKVKDLTTDGRRYATSSKGTNDAFLRKGTKITLLETKMANSGNLWGRIPSGWMCIWEKDIDRKFIK